MFMPAKFCEDFDVNKSAEDAAAVAAPLSGKLRKNYAGRCVIVHGIESCLYAYPVQNWERLIADLHTLPSDDDNIRDLLRHYMGSSTFCDIDKQGRLTIPQEARNYAGLVRELACVGMVDVLEIWDRETYTETMKNKNLKEINNYVSNFKRRRAQERPGDR
jgi:MraZ protein